MEETQNPQLENLATPPSPTELPVAPVAAEIKAPHYAGGWIRFLAIIIDGILISIVAAIIHAIFPATAPTTDLTTGVTSMDSVSSYLGLLYVVIMLGLKQQTLGMMALKLKLVSLKPGKPNWWLTAILRQVLGGFVCVVTLGIGYLIIFWTPKKQGLHDYIAGTTIVRE